MTPLCTCCPTIWDVQPGGRQRPPHPAVARWEHRPGVVDWLCRNVLDKWFDNADDDPDMEPSRVDWIDGSRSLTGTSR